MAQQVKVLLVDDLDGNAADETLTFGLDGKMYEIDLSAAHAEELRSALRRYVEAARTVARRSRGSGARGESTAKIRAWAREQGFDVAPRGRIPQEVRRAYTAARG